jgi:3-dehydroquinate synthase
MRPTRLTVTSERGPYAVLIGSGILRQLPRHLDRLDVGRRLVVSSRPVWRLQGRRLSSVMRRGDTPAFMAVGETAKTLETVRGLYDACLARQLDRASAIVAFGGGVIGDVAGFAAASYLRGIGLVQVPTTLLAQVDSAIGGKVGVNLPAGKNLVGAFYSPSLVVCDPDVLDSLPPREFRAGLYEVIKYGVIRSPGLFATLERRLPQLLARESSTLASVVAECCRIKADVVMSDERESGPRRMLNFGHTVGHALEAMTDYARFRHGEAVGYGMLAAARLSVRRGTLAPHDFTRLEQLIGRLGRLPLVADLSATDALRAIAHDKKVVNGRLHFVLATSLGTTAIASDVSTRELVGVMRDLGMRP